MPRNPAIILPPLARFLGIVVLVSGLISIEARAQSSGDSARVRANVLSDKVAIGEFGTLVVEITGGDAALPESIPAEGLEIVHSGQQSSIEIVNGVRTIKTNHFYRFRGAEPGVYTIPPIDVALARETLQTRPIEITVIERGKDDAVDATRPYFAKLELTRTEFYVNEVIPFTVTAFVRGRSAISDVVQPRFEHESFVIRGFREVRTDGAELGNSYYSSATLPSSLFALKPGEHRLGPAELGVRILESGSGFGFSSFFSRTALRELATNTVRANVKPLPDGAPANFSGAVGSFRMSADASITDVHVGDPISMTFRITGTGNLQTLSAPEFTVPPRDLWRAYEASKETEDDGKRGGANGFDEGTVTFTRVIIPEAPVETIPEFSFSYFDPTEEKYVTRSTEPIPVKVSSDRRGDSTPTGGFPAAGDASETPFAAERPTPRYDDVLHIRTRDPRWIATTDLDAPGLLYYAMHAVFSVAFFTLVGFGLVRWLRTRRHTATPEGPPANFSEALQRIPKPGASRGEYYRSVARAVECWREEHGDAPAPVLEVLERVSRKCDQFLYSGVGGADSPITQEEAAEFQSILRKLPRH